jgi:hypothetical protein
MLSTINNKYKTSPLNNASIMATQWKGLLFHILYSRGARLRKSNIKRLKFVSFQLALFKII